MKGNKVFIEVTNEDIFNEVRGLRSDFSKNKTRTKINSWISTTSLTLVIGVILGGFFL